jgi:lysozyme family protein
MVQYTYERLQPGYAELWAKMTVIKAGAASAQAQAIIAHKDRYKAVEAMTGVPWFVVGLINMRESSGSFRVWLHNGDPMTRNGAPAQTVHVPAHRPPKPDVSWESGSYDALVTCEHYAGIKDWCVEMVGYVTEGMNGWGYRNPRINIPSPYLWGGTSVQQRGKFVRDGVYDASVMDPQLGTMAVLKQLMVLDPEASFVPPAPKNAPETPAAAPEAPPHAPEARPDAPDRPSDAPPANPKAIDTESQVKPLGKSKTIWGGVIGYATTAATALMSFIPQLNNPYTLAAFLVVLVVGLVALILVVKGRIDVNAIVKHLAVDDSQQAPS